MIRTNVILLAAVLLTTAARAQNENSLTRDEVGIIKKKLVAVFEAAGAPPMGYTKTEESYSLPTEALKDQSSRRFRPINASAYFKFGSASEKKAEKTNEEIQKEYEKKIAEAQAKGDYQLISKLAQEMSQKAGQSQLEAAEGKKDPITVQISFDSNPSETIDPDAVMFESPGVIALKFAEDVDSTKGHVAVYFDPVNLKDTKTLSKIDMKEPESGLEKRTAVKNVTVEFSGPMSEIRAWAKKLTTKKVLAQID